MLTQGRGRWLGTQKSKHISSEIQTRPSLSPCLKGLSALFRVSSVGNLHQFGQLIWVSLRQFFFLMYYFPILYSSTRIRMEFCFLKKF